MKKIIGLLIGMGTFFVGYAQELNSRVQVLAPNVSNINRKDLETIQKLVREFLNNNKWSSETYLPQERIDCNFVITITNWDGNSAYKAEAQIQSSRPIYGSTYLSTLLNINDKDFDFNFNQGQVLDFSEQNYLNNLSSLLAFYAYTIIGLDKDSFGKLGGSAYYGKAQNTLNIAQTGGNKGWKAFDGLRNRYWLNENLLNNSFQDLRVFIYNYHLNGLDRLQASRADAIQKITTYIQELQQMDKQKLGAIFPNIYFAAKADELVNVMTLSTPQERMNVYNNISAIDPANTSKYEELKKN